MLRLATLASLLVAGAALPQSSHGAGAGASAGAGAGAGAGDAAHRPRDTAAAEQNTRVAIERYRNGERIRMLHGSGQIPELTMQFWKEVTTGPDKGPTLIISAAGGAGAEGSAASYIANFERFGIPMIWLPIFGTNCPDLVNDPAVLALVEDAHAIYFSGGMPGMLQGCLYGHNGLIEEGLQDVPPGFSTPILDLILSKQVVGGDSAGLMAQPTGSYLTGIFPHDGATLIGGAYCPTGNMGVRAPEDAFIAHSHFSERGQQGPQLVAQWQEGIRDYSGSDHACMHAYQPPAHIFRLIPVLNCSVEQVSALALMRILRVTTSKRPAIF